MNLVTESVMESPLEVLNIEDARVSAAVSN